MTKIIDIYWQRVNLHLKLDKKITSQPYIYYKEEPVILDTENDEIIINVTNTPEGTMLDSKTNEIYIDDEVLTIDEKLLPDLESKSKVFFYNRKKMAYIVYFDANSEMNLKIKTRFMLENKHPKKLYNLAGETDLKGFFKIFRRKLIYHSINIFYFIFRLFKGSKKRILFLTENNDDLQWNLKALYEYLTNNKDLEINKFTVNQFQNKKSIALYLKELNLVAKSDIIFIDNYTPLFTQIRFPKKVEIVQVWHAGVGFKSVGYARFGLNGSPHPYVSAHRKYTKAFVDRKELIKIYMEVFGIEKDKFYPVGTPRLDGYLDKKTIDDNLKELYKINPEFKDNKIILFSPTYRGTGSATAYYDYTLLDQKEIYDFCQKNNYLFIIKMHPFIKDRIEIEEKYQDRILDYSDIDINRLIYIADIMITDYSSCAYEYSLFNRPLIFYRFDKEIYEYERTIHTLDLFTEKQYEVKTFDELMKTIKKVSKDIKGDRFANISKRENNNACEAIEKIVFGENE